jgi:purine-cytosine permease-like protein
MWASFLTTKDHTYFQLTVIVGTILGSALLVMATISGFIYLFGKYITPLIYTYVKSYQDYKRIKRYESWVDEDTPKEPKEPGVIMQYLKNKHDKICTPIVYTDKK